MAETFWSGITNKVRGFFGGETPPPLPPAPYATNSTGNSAYGAPSSTGLPSVPMPTGTAPVAYQTNATDKPGISFTKQFRSPGEAPTIAVVGGGLAGLMAVRDLLKEGHKVQFYNADNRVGGRVQSSTMGNCTVNAGAEIVDEDDYTMLKLCEEYKIPLIRRSTLQTGFDDDYQVGGKIMGEEALIDSETGQGPYAALRAQIAADQAAMRDANGQWTEQARGLDKMSADEYLRRHAHITPPHVDKIIRAAFMSDIGRDLHEQSALNLIDYACTRKLGDGAEFRIYQSDEAFIVKGGTETIIHAIEADIKRLAAERAAKGERDAYAYYPNTELKAAHPDTTNGMKCLEFFNKESNTAQEAKVDGVILAVPAHALTQVQGQEHLGLNATERKLVADTQYNQWLKVTFKTHGNPWQTDAQGNPTGRAGGGFTDNIYQSNWTNPIDGTVTFLMGGSATLAHSPADLFKQIKSEYAATLGKPVEAVFDESVAPCIRNWSKQNGCSVSPKPGTYVDLSNFSTAQRNDPRVGFAGTWIMKGNKLGFMENTAYSGLQAAKQVALACPLPSQAQAQTKAPAYNVGSAAAPTFSAPSATTPQPAMPDKGAPPQSYGANVERYANRPPQPGGTSVGIG